ncbi:MAG: hypothetical protein GY799_20470 [Desulfobulbaceae bacterium]|nr:hypothetical protein [Desulfobulbaceae bacterium]
MPSPDQYPLRLRLWHGNVFRALETVDDLAMDLDREEPTAKEAALLKKLEEFDTYIRNNAGFILSFGERQRYGETISTAFVESAINQVVSMRMVKKQQMRWSQQGAHLLLQVRTRVLNDELRDVFRKWYPNFTQEDENHRKAAELPRFFHSRYLEWIMIFTIPAEALHTYHRLQKGNGNLQKIFDFH